MQAHHLYEKLSGTLGPEAAGVLASYLEQVFEELRNTVTKTDFSDLKEIVRDLCEAQKRTEARVEELAEAQKRTEARVEELAEAQRRTEVAIESLSRSVDERFKQVDRRFDDMGRRFDVMGSRWGDNAEEAFRQGLLEVVEGLGFTVEHHHGQDPDGFINHTPRSYDLDILVRNGLTVVAEIKSSASGADVTEFHRCVRLFEQQTGRKADKAVIVAVTIQQRARDNAEKCGVVVATDFSLLRPTAAQT